MNVHRINRHLFPALVALGALALAWVATGFFPAHPLALSVTLLIGAVFSLGVWELQRFRQATAGLERAIRQVPPELAELGDWLAGVPASLQNAVRLRVEGERVALPGPALTPYLVGLLVMLGMLGTFLGMVVTLNGAVFALEGTPDLAAIRSAFAAPIRGLGLAFGTSVAGVASSAVLGLLSALSRRERLQAAQRLDALVATGLRRFSLAWQRQQAWGALQQQAAALPAVAQQLQGLVAQLERLGAQTSERLLEQQARFHDGAAASYTALARSVDQSLQASLAQATQAAGAALQPVLASAMQGIAAESAQAQARMQQDQQARFEELARRIDGAAAQVAARWTEAHAAAGQSQAQMLDTLGHSLAALDAGFAQRADALLAAVQGQQAQAQEQAASLQQAHRAAETQAASRQAAQLAQQQAQWQAALEALRRDEDARGQAAVQRLDALQAAMAAHLTTLGQGLEEPIARLIATASEAPRAAAEVIGQMREEISHSVARDNALLDERSRIMETLNRLLDGINHAAQEQRAVIDALVATAAQALEQAGARFAAQAGAEAARIAEGADRVAGGAVELSTLGETLAHAVQGFHEGNAQLLANLQRIEGALDKSMARSDEQLAYYVAQAREVVELSTHAQKDVVEALRQVARRQDVLAGEAA